MRAHASALGFIIRYTFPLPRLSTGETAAHQTSHSFHFFQYRFIQIKQFADSAFRTLQHGTHGVLIPRPQLREADPPNVVSRVHTLDPSIGAPVLCISGPADHPENCVATGLT